MTARVVLTGEAPQREPLEARRLSLSGAAWARLVELSGGPVFPDFGVPGGAGVGAGQSSAEGQPSAERQGGQAPGWWQYITEVLAGQVGGGHGGPGAAGGPFPEVEAELRACGVLVAGTGSGDGGRGGSPERVHPSVLADLAILTRPRVLIRVEANLATGRRLALLGLADELGVTVVRTGEDGGVELSMFAARTLGHEIVRLVPLLNRDEEDSAGQEDSADEEDSADQGTGWPAGEAGPGSRAQAARVVVPLGALAVPSWMARETSGEMHVDVMAVVVPSPGQEDADADAGFGGPGALRGRVLWLASSSGWIGVRPVPDGGAAARPVELLRTVPEDLPGWLAPMIATALDATVSPSGSSMAVAGADTSEVQS